MKPGVVILIVLLSLLFPGCDQKKSSSSGPVVCEFELHNKDTINRRDCKGRRQGKWVKNEFTPSRDAIWKYGDTLYFRDDVLVKQ